MKQHDTRKQQFYTEENISGRKHINNSWSVNIWDWQGHKRLGGETAGTSMRHLDEAVANWSAR
jgi:hypothetical protein